jgi:glycosyltransferase involved in cell wall biosynthesis
MTSETTQLAPPASDIATEENGSAAIVANGKIADQEEANGKLAQHPAPAAAPPPVENKRASAAKTRKALAVFCFEGPDSPIGRYLSQIAAALASRQTPVHIFSRHPFDVSGQRISVHAVGDSSGGDLLDQVRAFNTRAAQAFLEQFPAQREEAALLGLEWSSVPALQQLQASRNLDTILALNSLERQRSDMGNELSRQIEEIELSGLRQAKAILVQETAVAEMATKCVPECASRLAGARQSFPLQDFETKIDPGKVKELYQIGPTDPTILFIGDLDERHGPDVLMKSVPAIIKNNPQTRFVFAGFGTLYWPLKVIARYLMLEQVVRVLGNLEGQPLRELIQAADIVAVPSRTQTEWWPVLAAWAARRPVVATHDMAHGLKLQHEHNSMLIYPHESSCVWGIERLLFHWDLAAAIAANGRQLLEQRFAWDSVAEQIEELMSPPRT